jgi:hypothetical protein
MDGVTIMTPEELKRLQDEEDERRRQMQQPQATLADLIQPQQNAEVGYLDKIKSLLMKRPTIDYRGQQTATYGIRG